MIYDKTEQLTIIQKDITNSTYRYFKKNDDIFNNFIFGDQYYQTLCNIIYLFINESNLNYSIDCECLGRIDIVQLVSNLHEVYMKVNNYLIAKNKVLTERYKKNYINKVLRKKAWKFLFEQFGITKCKKRIKYKNNSAIDVKLRKNLKQFRYISLYVYDEDKYIEELSYDEWKSHLDDTKLETKGDIIRRMMPILNNVEKKVITRTLEGLKFSEIGKNLNLKPEQVRKIYHRAKNKLANHYIKITGGEKYV